MRKGKFSAFFAVGLLCLATSSWAASGQEGASFLDIPVGAGPAALGGAYSAIATDAYAPVWNPAGLGLLDSHQFAGQHLSYLESINYEYAAGALKLKGGNALAASAQYLGSGDIPGADLAGNAQSDYSSHFAAYSLAFGHAFGNRWALGLTGKLINAKISDVSSNAFAADLGSLYKVNDHITLAATLSNLGSKLKFLNDTSSLPLTGRLGGAYEPNHHWLLALQGDFPKSGSASAHMGVQWRPIEMVSLRAGYKTDTTKELGAMAGVTTGIGLNFWGQEFSYAWVPMGDLGSTQYFSLLLRFGPKEADRQNLIRGQDIKRHREVQGTEKDDLEGQQLMQLLKSDDEKTAKQKGTGGAAQ